MNLENVKIGTVLVANGNGERVKVKGFKVVEASPDDKQVYLTVKPYSPDALGYRKKYDISTWITQTYYEIEETAKPT